MSAVTHKHTIVAFRNGVPRWLRIFLFIVFALIFQFSNTVYLSLTGAITGAHQMLKEDQNFLFYMSMVGLCFVYPLLFRFKLRFTSRQLIIGCSLVVMLMMMVTMTADSIWVLAIASFLLGAAKMLGSFEALVSIQLIITPNKDFGVFFSVALGIVLMSAQASGYLASVLNDAIHWTAVYKIMLVLNAIMILLVQVLLRPIRVAKKLPLYGIDWLGAFLWCCLFSCLTYFFSYGQVFDWLESVGLRVSLMLALIFAILTIWRMFSVRRPYLKPRVFTIKSVNVSIFLIMLMQPFLSASNSVMGPFTSGVLHLDDLNTVMLNFWTILGVAMGAVFSYFWFLKINGSFNVFFVTAFACLTGYYLILYFDLSSYADTHVLYLPYVLRGIGNMMMFAGVGKYITQNVGLDIFTQVLCYLAMARNAIGSLVPASLIGYAEYWRTLDYRDRLGSKIDGFNPVANSLYQGAYKKAIMNGWGSSEANIQAGKLIFTKVNQQAVLLAGREIFGLMTVLGIVVMVVLMSLHFSKPFASQIPSWRKLRVILSGKKIHKKEGNEAQQDV